MTVRGCEVCGGNVIPLDEQGVFGYCENCGIVYALKDRLKGTNSAERAGVLRGGATSEREVPNTLGGVSMTTAARPSLIQGAHWVCPDCDTEIRSDNESDLEFAKREHIREYHPNRSTG